MNGSSFFIYYSAVDARSVSDHHFNVTGTARCIIETDPSNQLTPLLEVGRSIL